MQFFHTALFLDPTRLKSHSVPYVDLKNEIERLRNCKVNIWFLFQTQILIHNRKRSSSFKTGTFLDLKQTSNLKAGFPVYFSSAPIRIKLHKCIYPINAIWFMHTLYSALQTIEWFSKNFERAILFFISNFWTIQSKPERHNNWGGRIKSLWRVNSEVNSLLLFLSF